MIIFPLQGITPMLQIATEILKNPADDSQIFLIYANQTPDDILCKDILGKVTFNFQAIY